MNDDCLYLFEAYLDSFHTPSKNVKDGKGKSITIGDLVSLINEPEVQGEVREVLSDGNIVIIHSGNQWEEISPLEVELRVEEDAEEDAGDAEEEDTEEHDDGDQPESDVEALYTIIENALSNQDIDNQRSDAVLTVTFHNKSFNIVVTPA